jgi:hypothetical protein
MKTLDTDNGLIGHGFSRPFSRTLFGAIIALRGASCGQGFGARWPVYPVSDARNVANDQQRSNGYDLRPLLPPLLVFPFPISRLAEQQRSNASRAHTYRRAHHSCVRACAITCATVAALLRCSLSLLFLYLPEKKEEKQGVSLAGPATVLSSGVAGAVAGRVKPLKSFDLRGF